MGKWWLLTETLRRVPPGVSAAKIGASKADIERRALPMIRCIRRVVAAKKTAMRHRGSARQKIVAGTIASKQADRQRLPDHGSVKRPAGDKHQISRILCHLEKGTPERKVRCMLLWARLSPDDATQLITAHLQPRDRTGMAATLPLSQVDAEGKILTVIKELDKGMPEHQMPAFMKELGLSKAIIHAYVSTYWETMALLREQQGAT